ncbi:MAG TPA: hypothetical protein PK331_16655 [Gordonia sp. (in: high G+C Gram-positive bacteria)]|uniref:hypothetical protein n=1 Tax=Mycobacteriales TaxID=85007 RepID=UPI002456B8C3|nr:MULTISPECIES: hypothetical protein [Mycobacteriales]HNP58620.1 hypothetical protein [Gordonia sp. (in: high G+C Gram-positive bacteria)]HRC52541.1 hypothetical protein [Gordonia sp. (in: high G+C Gram-positive bacteria)]
MKKKQTRPLSRAEFERELAAAVEGRPCDRGVAQFWAEMSETLGVRAAAMTPAGIEMLRHTKGGAA